jgi:hypothetical protein
MVLKTTKNFFQKGASIAFAIIILSILLAMALSLMTIFLNQKVMIKGIGDSVGAFYAADTGIERVLYIDSSCRADGCSNPLCDASCGGIMGNDTTSPLTGSVGQASYKASYNDGAILLKATGSYRANNRAIQVDREE